MNENEQPKQEQQPAIKGKSEEYQNFENALMHTLTVPKEELDFRLKADKEENRRKTARPSDTT
jgi:hypothetical protein